MNATQIPFEEDERLRVETLPIAEIVVDQEIRPRHTDPVVVGEYKRQMAEGDEFPPLEVVFDGARYFLVDGFHRFEAARANGSHTIPCAIRRGDRRAALLASCRANSKNGLSRSALDKRRAVLKMLNDLEWSGWADRQIARHCRVSNTLVGEVRATVNADSECRTFVSKHGTIARMNVSRIGRNSKITAVPMTMESAENTIRLPAPPTPDTRPVTLPRPSPAIMTPVTLRPFGEAEMSMLEKLLDRAVAYGDLRRLKELHRELGKAIQQRERNKRK